MSRDVAALVYSRMAGSMARKSVLAYMAERANDDGGGVWASKQRIANEVECSKRTVITTIQGLIADGLLEEAGQHKTSNGYTVIYNLKIDAISALPASKRDIEEVQNLTGAKFNRCNSLTPRGETASPKPSLNRPLPSEAKASSGRARKISKTPIMPDWLPREQWEAFVEMRKTIHKPMTDWAIELMFRKLTRLVEAGHPPGDVLDQSTLNNWQDVYPVKATAQATNPEGISLC